MKFKNYLYIKYDLQTYIENNIFCKKGKEKNSGLMGTDLKIDHHESHGKTDHKNEHNIREYDISG